MKLPPIEYFNHAQGSDEWFACRRGIPTASMFKTVKASSRDGGDSKTRDKYMRQLAGEIITGKSYESYSNARMDDGKRFEPELRAQFELLSNCDVEITGFFRRGRMGASPDGLIGRNATLEIKSAEPHVLIEIFRKGEVPREHLPQIQGNLMMSDREVTELAIGWPGMPMFRRKVPRDAMEQQKLRDAIDQFNTELDAIVSMMRRFGA